MVSFRKAILLLAVLALAAGTVSAQAISCTTRSTPTIMRAEGLTEEAGRIDIECTGLTPGQAVGPLNFRLFTSPWQITSRVTGTSPTTLESTLLIGEPASATVGSNAFLATIVPGAVASDGTVGAIEWTNVSFTPSTTTVRFHIVNVRINATPAGSPTSPVPVSATIAVTGSGLPVTSSVQTIGYIQKSMNFSNIGTTTVSQCGAGSSTTMAISFAELLPNALRVANGGPSQNNLSQTYSTESMYYPVGTTVAGVATQGTQIAISFSSLPTGVTYTAPASATGSNGTVLSLISAANANPVIYEVTSANTGAYDSFNFSITLNFAGTPPVGSFTATVSLYPGGSNTPVATPVPRFTTAGGGTGTVNIIPCQTRLLFPFITSDGGFDTGIAISNTSKDPWGTVNQNGSCVLNFYKNDGSNPTVVTSTTVNAGRQLVFSLSSGGGSVPAMPSFTGYLIAVCDFQYAHGYAFISDLGASKLAQGYLALVLGTSPISNNARYGGTPVEALNQ